MTLAWAAWVVPLVDLVGWWQHVNDATLALPLALAGSGAAIGLHIAAAFYFRIPFWYGLIFPLGYTAGALMALDSVRRRRSGRVRLEGPDLFMKAARRNERRGALLGASPRRGASRLGRDPRDHDRRRHPRDLPLFHQADFAAVRARRHRRLHLHADFGLGREANGMAASAVRGRAVSGAVRRFRFRRCHCCRTPCGRGAGDCCGFAGYVGELYPAGHGRAANYGVRLRDERA